MASRTLTDLAALTRSPRELWIVYGLKFLESLGHFAVYNLLIVYLTDDLGMSDKLAGTWTGTWLTAVSLATFVSGAVSDSIGTKRALWLAITSCVVGRVLLTTTTSQAAAITALMLQAWGVGAMIPTMAASIRRLTTKETVAFAFSLFYVIMNVAAFIAPLLVAWLRDRIPRGKTVPFVFGLTLTSSQAIFLFATVVTFLAAALLTRFRGDAPAEATSGADAASAPPARPNPLAILTEVMRESAFWRFMLFVGLLVMVRLIFQHAHLTWPKYTQREFGADFPFARYWALNPLLIMTMTPFVTMATRNLPAFWAITVGTAVTSLAVFPMVMSTTVAASVVFIVILSVGEAVWSPRLYEYTTVIAPRGREATYQSLAELPRFLAKPVVGFASGALLAAYCPPTGPRESQTMWLVIGLATLSSPVLVLLLRSVIEGKKKSAVA